MKIRLHKPKQTVWSLALVLFVVGVVAVYIPGVALLGYPMLLGASALLLLGTSVF